MCLYNTSAGGRKGCRGYKESRRADSGLGMWNTTVAVVVPLRPLELCHAAPLILASIGLGTKLPALVVLAVSGLGRRTTDCIGSWPFPVFTVGDSSSPSAGRSRNLGKTRVGSETDVIAFLDSDDPVHPQWLEYVSWFFSMHPGADVLLGHYLFNTDEPPFCRHASFETVATTFGISFNTSAGRTEAQNAWFVPGGVQLPKFTREIAHGIPAIRTSVAAKMNYTNLARGEDSEFLRALVQHNKAVAAWAWFDAICYSCTKWMATVSQIKQTATNLPACWSHKAHMRFGVDSPSPPRRMWVFWFGPPMVGKRKEAYQALRANAGLPVTLVTDANLAEFAPPGTLHPAFKHLSANHKSDYLWAYFMHRYGGAAHDVKYLKSSILPHFKAFDDAGVWAVGYKESAPGHIGCALPTVRKLGIDCRRVRERWRALIGNGVFIMRANTPLTRAWLGIINDRLDDVADKLAAHPAPFARCCFHHEGGYPLTWNELCGGTLHPLEAYFHGSGRFVQSLPRIDARAYRGADEDKSRA